MATIILNVILFCNTLFSVLNHLTLRNFYSMYVMIVSIVIMVVAFIIDQKAMDKEDE